MAKFEFVEKYADAGLSLPEAATAGAAGYDIAAAEDTIIPSAFNILINLENSFNYINPISLDEMAVNTKTTGYKPTLVPTGIKCQLDSNTYLQLVNRSSSPLKYWLILANGVGVIDADYYNNPDNEGHIYFQFINLSPFDIIVHKGDKIGQGIICPYLTTEDDNRGGKRTGGFGSTTK